MRHFVVFTVLFLLSCIPGSAENHRSGKLKKWWVVSAVALSGATFIDARTSFGKLERNPFMQNSNGEFSAGQGIALKAGISGVLLLMQSVANRDTDRYYKTSMITNFVTAGVFGGTSIYNNSVPRVTTTIGSTR